MPNFGQPYDNVDDAAAAALLALSMQPRVDMQEYMALLVKEQNGKFRRTEFQTQRDPNTSSWEGRPEGSVAGIVHNHPAQKLGDLYPQTMFSREDLLTSEKFKNPSYIAAIKRGEPSQDRVYSPTGVQPKEIKGPAEGQQFLAQYPIEELKMQIAKRIQLDKHMDPDMKTRMLKNLLVPSQSTLASQ